MENQNHCMSIKKAQLIVNAHYICCSVVFMSVDWTSDCMLHHSRKQKECFVFVFLLFKAVTGHILVQSPNKSQNNATEK